MIHLHNHTDGSILDGGASVKKLVARAVELGMNALGITDHGNMINALSFQEECLKQGIKPIIGCEFYLGEENTKDKFHLILLAKNDIGIKNLYKLNTQAYMTNFYYKPRITWNMLLCCHEGLVCTTACLGSEFAKIAEIDKFNLIRKYHELFGEDFYLELQPNGVPMQKEYNRKLVAASELLNIPLTVSCDVHYVLKSDYESHDTLLCMQTQKKKDDVDRFKFTCNDFYMKTVVEVRDELFQMGIPGDKVCEAINNTHAIADKCNGLIAVHQQLLPKMLINIGDTLIPNLMFDESSELGRKCNNGFMLRREQGHYDGMDINIVIKRIFYELSIIKTKGYAGYFLIEEDLIREANSRGIFVGKGRGSACGSEVAFILGITGIEPIKHGLIFERFLNPERNSPPDIDNDFCYERREEMVQYMKDKYGASHIAHIIAKGTLGTVSVIRKVLTAYGYEPREVNRVSKMFRDYKEKHKNANVLEIFDNVHEFAIYMGSKQHELTDMINLENLISHTSKHAAGIALCSKPISDYVPCMRDKDDLTMLMTQWDKHDLETVGVYKFDFLGLKTLTIIRKTLENINNTGDYLNKSDMDSIDKEDPNLYAFLNKFEIAGIFQFDAPAGKQIMQRIKATCFADIVAGEALCRPGVKEAEMYISNKKSRCYPSTTYPVIDSILRNTYGAIVYQEQTMLIMQEMTGWSLGKCDSMRKVKDLEIYRDEFVRLALERGYSFEFAMAMFDRFSLEYTFNKSHAVAYADNTCQTLYLACYYPVEFMSAVMSMELYASAENSCLEAQIKQCRRMGIEILPPDINISGNDFSPEDRAIRYPLRGIKGVGEVAIKEIIEKRHQVGTFDGTMSFICAVTKSKCKTNTVSQLIKSGCFDNVEVSLNRASLLRLCLGDQSYDNVTWSKDVKRSFEIQTFQMMLTTHQVVVESSFTSMRDGDIACLAVVKDIKKCTDRNGNPMAFVKFDTSLDEYDGILFNHKISLLSRFHIGAVAYCSGRKDGNSLIIEGVA